MILTSYLKVLLLACFLFVLSFLSFSNVDNENNIPDTSKVFITDDPVLAMIDSLIINYNYIENETIENKFSFASDSVPHYHDTIIEQRLKTLDSLSPFSLVYNNSVQAYIDVYTKRRRERASHILGMAKYYFPLFEETLDKYNLPLEFKYLAIVESALNPKAKSRAGATGLWQFMYRTGVAYGLNVSSYIDERSDPIQSTEAACKYFTFLYSMYNDWNLVLAAYNAGPGNVNKAIRRARGIKDYWRIRPLLPKETRSYVPAFIAVNYFMNYSEEHNIKAIKPEFLFHETDTINVNNVVTFQQISKVIEVPVNQIKILNPSYSRGLIPCTNGNNVLVLPYRKAIDFINNEELVYKYGVEEKENEPIHEEICIYHRIRNGECLGGIANKYGCTVSQLKAWNNLKGTSIRAGKTLIVYQTVKNKPKTSHKTSSSTTVKPKKTSSNKEIIYYTIKSGDTLWDISKKYNVSVAELKQLNNIYNTTRLRSGKVIKISIDG